MNGRIYHGEPAEIPIGNHVQVQLDVGAPVTPFQTIAFPQGL